MKRLTFTVAAALVILTVSLTAFHPATSAQSAPPNPAFTVNAVSLNFTTAQMVNSQTVRAFVPTASQSGKCLATLNETNNVQPGTILFCGEREPAALGGVPGMLVTVIFPQPVTPDFVMSVTLYQQGARSYGVPVLCTDSDGC